MPNKLHIEQDYSCRSPGRMTFLPGMTNHAHIKSSIGLIIQFDPFLLTLDCLPQFSCLCHHVSFYTCVTGLDCDVRQQMSGNGKFGKCVYHFGFWSTKTTKQKHKKKKRKGWRYGSVNNYVKTVQFASVKSDFTQWSLKPFTLHTFGFSDRVASFGIYIGTVLI